MDQEFDVIVVGAGFGGPVAALICAQAGLKTLIIERSENVGDKVISGLTIPFYGFLFGPEFIRDGNPPIERPSDGIINYIIKDIEKGDIEIDDSLKVPKPFSPVFAFGYNTYCKLFCEWEVRKAVDAGALLKKSTTVIDVIKEEGCIKGIITDKGERIRSKIIIDAEGSKGLLAIKAGVRKKYRPETISLADTYDYVMLKEDVDKIFGYSVKMCWGWDEQRIAPPLGYGNGLMVWPYRNSLHFMQDQCLKMNGGLCDGVPAAWFSAEIAAHLAIEAISSNDTSKSFLDKYDRKIKNHPIIQWSISGRNRYNLRNAQKEHSLKKLRKYIHNGWGLGALTHFMTPFFKLLLLYVKNDPTIITKWIRMFFRYYQNWLYESYDYSRKRQVKQIASKKLKRMEKKFMRYIRVVDSLLKSLKKRQKLLSVIVIPFSNSLNNLMKKSLPIFEQIYSIILRLLGRISNRFSFKIIKFTEYADPKIFQN